MVMSAVTIFVSGSYFSPAITMMQNASSKANSGNVVSSYTFFTTISQILAPAIFNELAQFFQAFKYPQVYGNLISLFVTFGYLISAIYYFKAGKMYKKHMEGKEKRALNSTYVIA